MPVIGIWQDSKRSGRCRSCGAPLTWAKTLRGKNMPFDGQIVVLRTEGNPLKDRLVDYVDTDVTKTHFETCPQANDWRRR